MVLMRRKDKRRGNEAEEIVVASDSSIVANKGVRSLQSARTGRFAADMRVQVGGYGRADKTWGVDHPWHKTREEIVDDLSARDHMEEGLLVKQEPKPQGQGLSRAALKKKKAKMKKGGLTESTAGSEMGSEAPSSVAEPKATQTQEKKPAKKETKAKNVAPKQEHDDEEKPSATATPSADVEETAEGQSKKRKRVNRNKKKQQKARADAGAGDDSEDEEGSDLDASVEVVAKAKKRKAEAADAQPTQVVASTEKDKNHQKADAAKREAVAKQYEAVLGQEFATASGLVIRDVRHGQGRVPMIGEMVTVRYRGRIDDKNGIVFGKGMLTTSYGTGSVIAGWEEGMGTMRTGGIRHLTVPPALAYGDVAKGTKIPANATLFFEIELVRLGKRKREAVAKDDIPLPSSFQRKKSPSASTANKDNKRGAAAQSKGKGKGRRRKHSI